MLHIRAGCSLSEHSSARFKLSSLHNRLQILTQIIHSSRVFDGVFTSLLQGFHVDTLTMDLVSPLHEACLGGHYACAKFLLENGAKVRTRQAFFHSLFVKCLAEKHCDEDCAK